LKEALPPLVKTSAVIGVNVIGKTPEEYELLARRLSQAPIHFLELNVSCPNLKSKGGLSFGSDPDACAALTEKAVKAAGDKPVMVKLPPLVSDLTSLAKKVESAGASFISLINSVPAMAVDINKRAPKLGIATGGLSGPPIKPLALRQVFMAAKAVKIPVVGLGGIFSYQDALEFIMVGAAAVQIGTAILVDPTAPLKIIEGLGQWLKKQKLTNLKNLKLDI
jgi:dihydroorotate dehydrogenase (NAD+) catalytic subunit